MSRLRAKSLAGRHVLLLVLGFFATVSAVNAVMIWLALNSHPGTVSGDAYREGLAYNRTIEARRAQQALGWQGELQVTGAGDRRQIVASFVDRAAMPIAGLAVTARLIRPGVRGDDIAVTLGDFGGGWYRAEVNLPLRGRWQIALDARRASGAPAAWHMERELWLD